MREQQVRDAMGSMGWCLIYVWWWCHEMDSSSLISYKLIWECLTCPRSPPNELQRKCRVWVEKPYKLRWFLFTNFREACGRHRLWLMHSSRSIDWMEMFCEKVWRSFFENWGTKIIHFGGPQFWANGDFIVETHLRRLIKHVAKMMVCKMVYTHSWNTAICGISVKLRNRALELFC